MRLTLRPLSFVDINHYQQVERINIVEGNPGTFYAQLWDLDAGSTGDPCGVVGQRYVPTSTQTFKLLVQRTLTITPVPAPQDFSVPMVVADARDQSILKWNWSAAQLSVCISGGVYLQMTDSSTATTYTWTVDHFLRKRMAEPGL